MKVIKPITITSGMLLSSSVPETDYAAWSAATAYALGAKVIRTSMHRIYQRLVSGTTATAPESDPVNWLDIGPTNRWAMFDGEISTSTTKATSLAVTLAPGRASGLALIGLASAEFAFREHFAGHRSHTTLLAAIPAVIVAGIYGPPRC